MAQSQEPLFYPKSHIALGAGDLVQVTNFRLATTNDAKKKATLRKRNAGFTLGVETSTLSFDMEIDEEGVERDYLNMIRTGETQKVRIALPGGQQRVFTGVATSETLEQPLDDALKASIEMIGGVEET